MSRPARPAHLATAALLLAGAACTRGSRPAPVTAPADATLPKADDRQVLHLFGQSPAAYELSIQRCAGGGESYRGAPRCPIQLRLLAGDRSDEVIAVGEAACGAPRQVKPDPTFGTDPAARAWMTGGAGCQVGVAAREVRVAPGQTALLVSQRIGWEHVGRRHWLFLAREGKLQTLWSHEEETSSNLEVRVVAPVGGPPAIEALAVVQTENPSGLLVEDLKVKRLRWDPAAGRLIEHAMPEAHFPLFVSYLGPFKSAEAARSLDPGGHPECLLFLSATPARLLPGLGLRGYLLARVSVSRAEGTARDAELAACPPGLKPRFVEVN